MKDYSLGFVSNQDLFEHTLNTVKQFRTTITLNDFIKNIVDPIKLTFDSYVYRKSVDNAIEAEIARQLGKTNENLIGYFHQNMFKYLGNGWEIPDDGFDVVNYTRQIWAEFKNKHNTMNSSSASANHAKMKGLVLGNQKATCYLVEIIAKKSQDIPWCLRSAPLNPDKQERLRRISIDQFYEIATGDKLAFCKLCSVLGQVIDDIIDEHPQAIGENTVLQELRSLDADILKRLFSTSFATYHGFDKFTILRQ